MELEMSGKTVVITGGTRGIGLASAQVFLDEGAYVNIVGRDPRLMNAVIETFKAKFGNRISGVVADLETASGRSKLANLLCNADVLVNNAGAIPGGGLEAGDEWRQAWELKVFGYIELSKIALRHMVLRRSGVIVNVIGIAGVAPSNNYIFGSMANSALIAMTRAAGAESTKSGVRIVGINPGPTETDRLRELYMNRAKEKYGDANRWQEMLQHLPFGRPAQAREMAYLIAFLASSKASYLSGVVIDADGGARDAG